MKKIIALILLLSVFVVNFSVLAVRGGGAGKQENKLNKYLKTALVTGGALAACYGAYKIGDKTGLNKEIKNIYEFICKNRVLKNSLILCSGAALPFLFFAYLLGNI